MPADRAENRRWISFMCRAVFLSDKLLEFILRQIDRYRRRITKLEKRHGMSFEDFSAYLKERSALLSNDQLDPQQKRRIAQAVMLEEEDWLDWKIARDFLEGWLSVKAEARA